MLSACVYTAWDQFMSKPDTCFDLTLQRIADGKGKLSRGPKIPCDGKIIHQESSHQLPTVE